jgi:hypothetical protein
VESRGRSAPIVHIALLAAMLIPIALHTTLAALGTPPPLAGGPDLVGSAVGSALSELGAVGGIGAYSMTLETCNIGNADAVWIDSGPQPDQHPVTGLQLYRLESVNGTTRFEQLGMSWLTHGFCAADAMGCTQLGPPGSTYTPNPSCDYLGPFATNTHSAAFNALQSPMSARSEVDPWAGAFVYPPALGGGQTGDAIYKRLQVAQSDLDPTLHPGATYWGEVVHIATDESDAERMNNYSVRRVVVGPFNGAQYDLAFSGATEPMVSALEHWATIDAGVSVTHADVPGDGRLHLAWKVTNLGANGFHYEYALFNRNSRRSAQAIAVPLPPGTSATGVGFHDVDYHSGEPFSPADWSASVVPGQAVTWSSETYAANVNANALRWSTTYNYRFDASAAPALGLVTVTLFEPGTPTTVTFVAEVPSLACTSASYCTTSTTSLGCTPTMTSSGTPSASAASGFFLDCVGLEGQKRAVIFFGTAPVSAAWAPNSTSTRCVDLPAQRTPSANASGDLGQCNGVHSLDWNAWRAANPSGIGSPYASGVTLYAQTWFRDPPAATGTNLSDARSFTLCP